MVPSHLFLASVACLIVSAVLTWAQPIADWRFEDPAGTPLTALKDETGAPSFTGDGSGIEASGNGALSVRRPRSGGALYYAPLEADPTKPVWLVATIRGWDLAGPAEEAVRFGLADRPEAAGGLADIRLERTSENEVSIQGIGHGGGTPVEQRPLFLNPQDEPVALALHYNPEEHFYQLYTRRVNSPWELLGTGTTHHERRANFLRLNFVNRFNDSDDESFEIERIYITHTPVTALQEDLSYPPSVSARAWAIADARTGKILASHDGDGLRKSASITKAMCALVVIRMAEKDPSVLNETIVFSERASAARGSHTGLKAGEALSVRDALFGLMLPSGNDAGNAIAEHFNDRLAPPEYSTSSSWPERVNFVAEMNRYADELGMKHTFYRIPFGDGGTADDHTTTAHDLMLLAREGFSYPLFREVVGTKTYTGTVIQPGGGQRKISWTNTNQFLGRDGFDGIKTGTTANAGACLLSTAYRGDDRLFVAVLGSSYRERRYLDSETLYNWAWETFFDSRATPANNRETLRTD